LNFGGIFDLKSQETQLKSLHKESLDPSFWNDKENASKILRNISRLENNIKLWADLEQRNSDISVLFEFAESGEIQDDEISSEIKAYAGIIRDLELKLMLGESQDIQDAIITIHAGAGGTESQDWAEMLRRMYIKWVANKKFKSQLISEHKGDEAGIKSSTIKIEGDYIYGWLKSESGIHRLVRISPFDSGARRHTSFASVWVYPVVDENINIEIIEKDLRIDTYRSSGAGGQHVNTTDSAVRITHLPTKIVVQCQNERSQHKNKETCMNMLKARLYDFKIKKREQESKNLESSKSEIGWGHQIRSYVLHPYRLVKDNRTNHESSNPDKVLNGEIDDFLESSLYKIYD